tara:strand:- start:1489 stop:1701 length:213 start_codon:yes stop_codon:yes gene_type:complete
VCAEAKCAGVVAREEWERSDAAEKNCKACKTARADPPSSKRIKREPESSPEIKQEEPESFNIRGYFGIGE